MSITYTTGDHEYDLVMNMKAWLEDATNIDNIKYNATEAVHIYAAQPHMEVLCPAIFIYATSSVPTSLPKGYGQDAIEIALALDLFLRDAYYDITLRGHQWASQVRDVVNGDTVSPNHWREEVSGCQYLTSHEYPGIVWKQEYYPGDEDNPNEIWGAATITFKGVKIIA